MVKGRMRMPLVKDRMLDGTFHFSTLFWRMAMPEFRQSDDTGHSVGVLAGFVSGSRVSMLNMSSAELPGV